MRNAVLGLLGCVAAGLFAPAAAMDPGERVFEERHGEWLLYGNRASQAAFCALQTRNARASLTLVPFPDGLRLLLQTTEPAFAPEEGIVVARLEAGRHAEELPAAAIGDDLLLLFSPGSADLYAGLAAGADVRMTLRAGTFGFPLSGFGEAAAQFGRCRAALSGLPS